MKTDQSLMKIITGTFKILLQTLVLPVLLLIIYGLSIYITSGYGQGKLAAAISIALALLLLVFAKKTGLLKSKVRYISFLLVTAIFGVFVVYTIVPVASSAVPTEEKDFVGVSTRYWTLSTGSHIAYYKLSAADHSQKKEFPIIFLHGGPGAYVRQIDIDFFSEFTKDGYDVYLYDQAGSGRSGLLNKSSYSHLRNIQDVAAIIDIIKAKKYIVIGQSYGGSLLAHLSANEKTSKRIDKAIYAEPGVTLESAVPDIQKSFAKSLPVDVGDVSLPIRLMISILIDPRGEFASQNEIVNYPVGHPKLIQSLFSEAYPKKDSAKIPKVDVGIINFSANTIISSEVTSYMPKKQLAEKYREYQVPSMLMLGESSYIERNGPLDLLSINHNIKRVQYLKGVGHLLWNGLGNSNQRAKQVIDDFLNDHNSTNPNYPRTKAEVADFYKKRL
ncbi:pimeloyl-ACP methyl ester carboxylesterase [Chryseobacterium ginsenosidimutans]|uniref:alpha/beta hydrolase n=1 Tax=Chryseobacterium ginsenosidimutans TaxID=687846 RepID=UPI002780CD9B|nr:alpha/beta hydrolase [Chryseobacterium ginsenosidimutans]MDQ0593632.1 pimeloyl-ACP methyl ester carboxylesterase [Chryseobacterium ginsenosidimutans]